MKTIINKRPGAQYLENRTFTINEREYDVITNPDAKSEIHVHTQENELAFTIKKSQYSKLVCHSRTSFAEGEPQTYFIVDFSAVHK